MNLRSTLTLFQKFVRVTWEEVTWQLPALEIHPQSACCHLRISQKINPTLWPFFFLFATFLSLRRFVKARVKFNQHFPRLLATFRRERTESRKQRRCSSCVSEINFQFPRQRFVWRCRAKLFSLNEKFTRKERKANFGCEINFVASPRTPNGNNSPFARRRRQNKRRWLNCQDQILLWVRLSYTRCNLEWWRLSIASQYTVDKWFYCQDSLLLSPGNVCVWVWSILQTRWFKALLTSIKLWVNLKQI